MRIGVVLAWFLVSAPARADKWDETLDVSLRLTGGWFEIDELPLHVAPFDDAPALLEPAELRFWGSGPMIAGTLRGNLSVDGFRGGLGVGYAGFDGLKLRHQPFGDGEILHAGRAWSMHVEAFFGYAFGFWEEVKPYIEVRGALTVVQTRVEAVHPSIGSLGTTAFNAYAPSGGLSAGVLVPINEYLFFDGGGTVDVIGPVRFSLHAALGLPIPLSHL